MTGLGISQINNNDFRVYPKSKKQTLAELRDLQKKLGLSSTADSTMKKTHEIVKRVGSLTDALSDIRENEKQ